MLSYIYGQFINYYKRELEREIEHRFNTRKEEKMNIFSKIQSLFTRTTVKSTVNTFTQLKQIYTGLRGLNLSIINRVHYPILYKELSD